MLIVTCSKREHQVRIRLRVELKRIGDLIFELAAATITDERLMAIGKERKRLREYGKKTN